MNLPMVRTITVILLPFAVIAAIAERLWTESKAAVRLAWLDARIEIDAARRAWRTGRFD